MLQQLHRSPVLVDTVEKQNVRIGVGDRSQMEGAGCCRLQAVRPLPHRTFSFERSLGGYALAPACSQRGCSACASDRPCRALLPSPTIVPSLFSRSPAIRSVEDDTLHGRGRINARFPPIHSPWRMKPGVFAPADFCVPPVRSWRARLLADPCENLLLAEFRPIFQSRPSAPRHRNLAQPARARKPPARADAS